MAKRFTDGDKWRRPWFRNLSLSYKLFWIYLTDHCDAAGVWYVDFEHASFCVKAPLDQQEALLLFEKQVEVLGDGSRWFIPDFIPFQYGALSLQCLPHRSILNLLEKHKIERTVIEGYRKGISTLKEKEEDKEEEEEEEKEGDSKEKKPEDLLAAWNEGIPEGLRAAKGLNPERERSSRARLKERPLEDWVVIIARIRSSDFCRGKNDRGWRADFDWLIRSGTAVKVLEGKYDDRKSEPQDGVIPGYWKPQPRLT